MNMMKKLHKSKYKCIYIFKFLYSKLSIRYVKWVNFWILQLESLQNEAEKLQDEKPEEAAAIREKIAEINNVWMDLKDMVRVVKQKLIVQKNVWLFKENRFL